MLHPWLMSLLITFPPNGITAVCRMIPSWKIAISVVPPPMSTKAMPASFSSSVSTDEDEANGSRTSWSISSPAFVMHL